MLEHKGAGGVRAREGLGPEFRAIFAAEFLAMVGFSTSLPVAPFYLSDLGVQGQAALNTYAGLFSGIGAVTMAVFAPIWGALSDKFGRRLMLLRAMLGGCAVMALMALARSPEELLALRVLQGVLTGTVAAANTLLAGFVPPKRLGYALGLLTTGLYAGQSLGPPLGGLIADAFGNRAAFASTSVLLVVAALIVIFLVPSDSKRLRGREDSGSGVEAGKRAREDGASYEGAAREALPRGVKAKLGGGAVIGILALIFGMHLANQLSFPVLPLFVGSIAGEGGAAAVAASIAAALLGGVSARFGYGRSLVACLMGAGLFLLPQGFAPSPEALLPLRAIGSFFFGGAMPSANALLASKSPERLRGAIFGLSSSMVAAGQAVGPILGSAAANALGYPWAFLASGVLLMGIGASFAFARSRGGEGTFKAA
jgi:DHA1 family multidrug resistance protein-like MFS transporter